MTPKAPTAKKTEAKEDDGSVVGKWFKMRSA